MGGPSEYEAELLLDGYFLSWNSNGVMSRYSYGGSERVNMPASFLSILSDGPNDLMIRVPPNVVEEYKSSGLAIEWTKFFLNLDGE